MYLKSTKLNTSLCFTGVVSNEFEYIVVVFSTSIGGTNGHLKPAVNHPQSVSDVHLIIILQDYCPEAIWYCNVEILHLMTSFSQEVESVGETYMYKKTLIFLVCWVRVVTRHLPEGHRFRIIKVGRNVNIGVSAVFTTDPAQ